MCIFCDIIDGKIPSKIVYEDKEIIAILDISQTTKGHTLVIPKKHYNNFLEMPENEFANLMKVVQQLSKKIISKLNAKGSNTLINTNEVSGQTVMHTHVHIIPRYEENDSIKVEFKENKLDLDKILEQIVA